MIIKSGVIFTYNYYMYTWGGNIYVFMYVVGYLCGDCSMHIYVDTLKVQINFTLLFVFHNISMFFLQYCKMWLLCNCMAFMG